MSVAPSIADPPFVAPRPWCRTCALADWKKAGKGICRASTHEHRKPAWMEQGQDQPAIDWHSPLDECWRFEARR